jgi:hypothetical protein
MSGVVGPNVDRNDDTEGLLILGQESCWHMSLWKESCSSAGLEQIVDVLAPAREFTNDAWPYV